MADIIVNIFKKIDADGSGEITKDKMQAVFKTFDKDGKISSQDIGDSASGALQAAIPY